MQPSCNNYFSPPAVQIQFSLIRYSKTSLLSILLGITALSSNICSRLLPFPLSNLIIISPSISCQIYKPLSMKPGDWYFTCMDIYQLNAPILVQSVWVTTTIASSNSRNSRNLVIVIKSSSCLQ